MAPASSLTPRLGLVAALWIALSSGCAASPLVQLAEEQKHTELAAGLDREVKAGSLEDAVARDVARAVATVAVSTAKGEEGEALVAGLVACAPALEGALDDRLEAGDDIGAAAGSVLLSAGLLDADDVVHLAARTDVPPSMRALGARGLVEPDDASLRRSLFLHLDERVRLGALRAALVAPVPRDHAHLLDAARRDPSPAARAAAARALGRLGGPRAVSDLADLWIRADGRMREAIVDAWAAKPSAEAGGRERLRWAAEQGGDGAVAAALLLARVPGEDATARAMRDVGAGVLARAAASGTRAERALALTLAPSSPAILEAVRDAADDTDPGIAIVAVARLAREGDAAERKKFTDRLVELAKTDDPEADRALGELASLGDRRAVEPLVKALASEQPFARRYAASALVRLGELPRAARLLADADASVRVDVACSILAAD